jgi:hypothetical protein
LTYEDIINTSLMSEEKEKKVLDDI